MKTVGTADCEGATGNLHVPLVCALGKRLWNVGTILNLADKLVNLTLRSSSLRTFLLAFLPKEDPTFLSTSPKSPAVVRKSERNASALSREEIARRAGKASGKVRRKKAAERKKRKHK